jgi:hypothetical protein
VGVFGGRFDSSAISSYQGLAGLNTPRDVDSRSLVPLLLTPRAVATDAVSAGAARAARGMVSAGISTVNAVAASVRRNITVIPNPTDIRPSPAVATASVWRHVQEENHRRAARGALAWRDHGISVWYNHKCEFSRWCIWNERYPIACHTTVMVGMSRLKCRILTFETPPPPLLKVISVCLDTTKMMLQTPSLPCTDDASNTFLALYVDNDQGHWKYAEFDPTGKQTNFSNPNFYELFDLVHTFISSLLLPRPPTLSSEMGIGGAPYEAISCIEIYSFFLPAILTSSFWLHANEGPMRVAQCLQQPDDCAVKQYLHTTAHAFYACSGRTCP